MSKPFTKLFPFLQRFHFPPHGEPLNPRLVSDELQLVHEMFRADVKFPVRLQTQDTQDNGAGADIDQTLIAEPPAGFVSIPLIATVEHTNLAGGINVTIKTVAGVGTPDVPTGTYGAFDWIRLGPSPDKLVLVPWAVPIPRGVFLRATWAAPAAPRIVRSRCLAVWVPIECVDWTVFQNMGGYVRTEAV